MDDEKASSAPRREGEVTLRRARSAPPALFVEPKSIAPEADPLPIEVPEVIPVPRRRPSPSAKSRPAAPAQGALPTPTDEPAAPDPSAAPRATPPRARKPSPSPAKATPPAATPRKRAKPRVAIELATDPTTADPTSTDTTETDPRTNSAPTTAATPTITAAPATEPAAATAERVTAEPTTPETATPEAAIAQPTATEPATTPTPAARRSSDRDDWRARTPKPFASRPSQADLWAAVRTRPALAPAALAIVAVDRFGPVARQRARWLSDTYPRVPAPRLARVAIREATTRARYVTAASLVPLGGVLGLSTQLWVNARMVLEIAAAFGQDPCADERAADLLTLLRIYPDERGARGAIATVTIIATAPDELPPVSEPVNRNLRAAITRAPVVGVAGLQLARYAAKRWFPGSGLVLGGLTTASATEALANRAIRFYRNAPHR